MRAVKRSQYRTIKDSATERRVELVSAQFDPCISELSCRIVTAFNGRVIHIGIGIGYFLD